MVQHLLIPGMKHGEKSELGAQMAGIGGNGEQRFRNGPEQDVVDDSPILKRQVRQFAGKRKHNVGIRHGQQFGRSGEKPFIARRRLTLRAVPVPARVVSEDLARAVVTLLEMAAESGGAACANVTECP